MVNLYRTILGGLAIAGTVAAIYMCSHEEKEQKTRLIWGIGGGLVAAVSTGRLLRDLNQNNTRYQYQSPNNPNQLSNNPRSPEARNQNNTYIDRPYIDNRQDNRRITIIHPSRNP